MGWGLGTRLLYAPDCHMLQVLCELQLFSVQTSPRENLSEENTIQKWPCCITMGTLKDVLAKFYHAIAQSMLLLFFKWKVCILKMELHKIWNRKKGNFETHFQGVLLLQCNCNIFPLGISGFRIDRNIWRTGKKISFITKMAELLAWTTIFCILFFPQLLYILGVYLAGPDVASSIQPIIPVWAAILAILTCTEQIPSPLHVSLQDLKVSLSSLRFSK